MAKKKYEKRTPEEIREEVNSLTKQLESNVRDVFESPLYYDFMKAISKFHHYSGRNTILILLQCPHASYVHGFKAWEKDFNRHVQKGERGIRIIARSEKHIKKNMDKIDPATRQPLIGSDGTPVRENIDITIPRYFAVSVFDISQTEGEPFPKSFYVDAKGNVENYETLLQAIQYAAGIPFYFEKIKGRSDGYYHHVSKDIHIQEGMNPSMTISTCLHEITHARLHDHDAVPKDQRKDRNTREVEAESVAFIVCEHFGVDTIAPSASYIAGWSKQKEPKELLESIDVIGDTSSDLIEQVENRYLELLKEKERGQKTEPERSSVEGRLLQLSQRTSNDRPDQEWSGREDQSQER